MKTLALKIVESPAFYRKEFEIPEDSSAEVLHSLHYSLMLPGALLPEFASFFISRFSRKGQVVLDPFSGSGSVGLEAALAGRIPMVSDSEALSVELTNAKLHPADLTEVTLKLQFANLKRPINLNPYRQAFSAFYDVDTYREIVNLREYLLQQGDRTSKFIAMLAASLLHGNNGGYFSVYSLPQVALTPEEQQDVNFKRGQSADYRPVVPRILRKAAQVFRDGIPSILHQSAMRSECVRSDARDLGYLKSSSVDLVVTAPPLPGSAGANRSIGNQWLRNWFLGFNSAQTQPSMSLEVWKDFMNESLLEMARVVSCGGRAVLELRDMVEGRDITMLEDCLSDVVQESLGRYWETEGLFVQKQKFAKLRNCSKERDLARSAIGSKALVLRRR